MHRGDDESPDTEESGYDSNPSQPSAHHSPPSGIGGYASQPSGFGGYAAPSQPWSWNQSPPPWASSPPLPPSQSWRSSPTPPALHRNLSRSAFGDYRPNLDALHLPRPGSPFQASQSPITEADQDAFDTMLGLLSSGIPDTPAARVETPVPTRGGSGSRGSGGGRGRGPRGGGGSRGTGNVGGHSGSCPGIASSEGSGAGGSGDQPERSSRGKPYSKDESIAVAKAWDSITSDPVVGTDQESGSFWRRVMLAYEELKPDGAEKRDPEQIRKKFGRILRATKLFASIYENNLRHAESGRSVADVKTLSEGQYHKTGQPKFTLWEEYLVLADCPKFRSIVANEVETAPGPKRTRHNLAREYSSGSGSHEFEQSDEQVEEPAATHIRRRRPMGQQAAIRKARGGRSASRQTAAASGSRIPQSAPIPQPTVQPHEVLANSIDVTLMQQLQDVCRSYAGETDPYVRNVYKRLINRLESRLGLVDNAPGDTEAGSSERGGGGEEEEEEEDEEADSDTE